MFHGASEPKEKTGFFLNDSNNNDDANLFYDEDLACLVDILKILSYLNSWSKDDQLNKMTQND